MYYKNLNKHQLKNMLDSNEDILLLDIRTKEEFEEKNIEKSINIPLDRLLFEIDEIDEFKNKKVVVYCRSGHRSITGCNFLYMEGFLNVYNLEKGIINYTL